MTAISGLHHITAIAGPAQRALDFHVGRLGRRLVKTTVNFDDPSVYHLYFGDQAAQPGGIFTVFPFEHATAGHIGAGTVSGFAYETDLDTLEALSVALDPAHPFVRFGERGLRFFDPDGVPLEVIAPADGAVRAGGLQDAAFHSVTLMVANAEATAAFLTEVFGVSHVDDTREDEGRRLRFAAPGSAPGRIIDILEPDVPTIPKAGAGSIHHIAFRAADEAALLTWRTRIEDWGITPTPVMDRQYFRSIYFTEPGGILFEIATDPPGFDVDEPMAALGESLKLPPRYEQRRAEIEASLPTLRRPARGAGVR